MFDVNASAIFGVVLGAFERRVAGVGKVLGVRFRPGGLRPFIDQPMARLINRTLPVAGPFGVATCQAEQRVLGLDDDAAMVAVAEAILMAVLPEVDQDAVLAEQIVAMAALENGSVSVSALCAQAGMHERKLQRLFAEFVGVSPKWVIQRYRLQDAMWRLSHETPADLAALAQSLGFYDQAHLTGAFTALVGQSPMDYWKSQRRNL